MYLCVLNWKCSRNVVERRQMHCTQWGPQISCLHAQSSWDILPKMQPRYPLVENSYLATSHQSQVHHYITPPRSVLSKRVLFLVNRRFLLIYCETNYPQTHWFKTMTTTTIYFLSWFWGCWGSAGQFFCSVCYWMSWNILDDPFIWLAGGAGCWLRAQLGLLRE